MSSDPRRQTGSTGEQLAAEHLVRRGLTIVERNYRTRWGELDIVAWDGGQTLVFCEVKCRRAADGVGRCGDPLEAVGPNKRRQVRRMASRWLVERQDRPRADELRFDAIGVTLDSEGRLLALDHLEAAF